MPLRADLIPTTTAARGARILTAASLLMLVGLAGLAITLLWPTTLEPVENAAEQRWLAQRTEDAALPITQVDSELAFVSDQTGVSTDGQATSAPAAAAPPLESKQHAPSSPPPLLRRCPLAHRLWTRLHGSAE